MGPSEARDLMFAGAGILWGLITMFNGMKEWYKRKIMKRAALLLLTVAFLCPLSRAEESKPADATSYLNQLQVKLDHAAQRANQPSDSGSSVVGLRGSKQEPLSKQLYWKGKDGKKPVSTDEVKMFRDAVDQAQAGKKDEAVTALHSFIQKYPTSPLRPDVDNTLALLKP